MRIKRNILITCLSVAASACLALSAVVANPKVAKAQGTISASNLITADNGTVTAKQTFNTHITGADITGLGVTASEGYSAHFNTVFNGNLEFIYAFPDYDKTKSVADTGTAADVRQNWENGNFKFTITNADDTTEYVDIICGKSILGRISMYAEYHIGDTVYRRGMNQNSYPVNLDNSQFASNYGHWPMASGYNSCASSNKENYYNKLALTWTDDVLSISYRYTNVNLGSISMMNAISFDGTTMSNKGYNNDKSWGVPKFGGENYSKNYTVSFSSEYSTGTDVVFTELNGKSLTAAESFAIGSDTLGEAEIIDQNGNIVTNGGTVEIEQGETLALYSATATKIDELCSATGGVYAQSGAQTVEYDGSLNNLVVGTYTLSLTNDPSFTFNVKVNGKKLEVQTGTFAATDLISANGATVTAKQTFNDHVEGQSVMGLGVVGAGSYDAQFTPVFNGDLTLEYLFPNTAKDKTTVDSAATDMYNGNDGQFNFRITAADDETKYVDLYFTNHANQALNGAGGGTSPNGIMSMYAIYTVGDKTYKRVHTSKAYWDNASYTGGYPLASGFNSNRKATNKLTLTWVDDVLTIYYKHNNTNGCNWQVINFDGLEDTAFNSNGDTTCHVPKFSKDYKISFSSDYKDGTDVVFTSINGKSLATVDTLNTSETVDAGNVINDKNEVVASGTTIKVATGAESLGLKIADKKEFTDLAVEKGSLYVKSLRDFAYTGALDLNAAGTYTITSIYDLGYTLTIEVADGMQVIYKVGETQVGKVSVADGVSFTLAAVPTLEQLGGKVFLGWTSGNINDSLYNAGAMHAAISEATTFTAVCVDMDMVAGAAVRKTEPTGIRFTTKISESDYNMVKAVTTFGTLIAPLDMVSANDLTVNTSADKCLNLVAKNWLSAESAALMQLDTDGYKYFTGVMTNVFAENFARKFVAKAYVTVTYADNTTETFYADCNEADNARSIYDVADASLDDGEADGLGVLAGYVNAVADITVSGDTVSKANDTATYTVDSSVADGVFTITVSGTISALVVNGVWISSNGTVQAGDISISGAHITHNDNGTSTITFTRN